VEDFEDGWGRQNANDTKVALWIQRYVTLMWIQRYVTLMWIQRYVTLMWIQRYVTLMWIQNPHQPSSFATGQWHN
jgi:hypothetical protein